MDDASPDCCGRICDEFAAEDSRVRVLHLSCNRGLSSARNCGIDACSGEFIAFVDGDDALSPQFIEALLMADVDIAQCAFCTDWSDMGTLSAVPCLAESLSSREALRRLQLDGTGAYTVVWNKLYRRGVFEGLRFPEGKQHEDEFVIYRAFWAAASVCIVQAPLYFYRQRPNSITDAGVSLKSLDAVEALEERARFYREHGEESLAVLTDATTCHRLREMLGPVRKMASTGAPQWHNLMWERYLTLMCSKQVSIGKKTRLTLQMISPKLHKVLASWRH